MNDPGRPRKIENMTIEQDISEKEYFNDGTRWGCCDNDFFGDEIHFLCPKCKKYHWHKSCLKKQYSYDDVTLKKISTGNDWCCPNHKH